MQPVIINNFLHSARILADGCDEVPRVLRRGERSSTEQIEEYVDGKRSCWSPRSRR